MAEPFQERLIRFLRWSEKYTKTDMVYLATSGFWFNMSTVIVSFFSLILYIVFARYIPKEVYGTYQYLISIAAIASTFTLTGMNTAVTQAVARGFEGTFKKSIRIQLLWNLVPATVALAGALYYGFAGNGILAAGFFLIAITTPLVNAYNTYSALLAGRKDFRGAFFYSMASNIPYYGGLIIVAIILPGVTPLFAANAIINTAMAYVLYRRTLETKHPNRSVDDGAFAYGKHVSVMSCLINISTQIDSVLVFHFLGPLDLAIYSFATAVPDRLTGFFRVFGSVAFPKLALRSREEIRNTIGYKLLQITVLGLLSALFYIIIAPLFFRVLFPQYAMSIAYSQLYALSMIGASGNLALTALLSQRSTKNLYLYNFIVPPFQVAVIFAGVAGWGLWGLIVAKIVSSWGSAVATAAFLLVGQRRSDS